MTMDRREFIKGGLAVAGAAAAASCIGTGSNTDTTTAEGTMTYRTQPRTKDQVSILGYGCMRWPMKVEDDGSKVLDQDMINTLVDKALEKGVNLFDTSPVYCGGLSEKVTGIALSRHDRSEYLVSTKLSNFDPRTHSREASMAMYNKSFSELQVDYIDYYMLHSLGADRKNFETRYIDNGMLDYLLEEREKGKIRHLGFSFHGPIDAFEYYLSLNDKYHWDFVLIQMNYVDWNYAYLSNPRNANARLLYEAIEKMGIMCFIMEPLMGGRLANVPQTIAEKLQEREPSRSVASWAFRFCGTHPGVLSVLSGMTYMEHLEDNLKSYSPLEPLSEDDLTFLDQTARLMTEYPTIPCNDCKYCIPCPYGIDIPGIIQHYDKCVNEGAVAPDKMDPNYRKARRRYLSTYAKAIPDLRQADKCIGCGICVPKCPQSIDIPKELRKIDRYIEKLRKDSE